MLLKAQLTLHSKMSGSRWVITPLSCLQWGKRDAQSQDLLLEISGVSEMLEQFNIIFVLNIRTVSSLKS